MKTIVLTGGGTMGHITPNLALLPKLKNDFERIIYIGSENGIEREVLANYPEVTYYPITTVKLVRSLSPKNLLIPFKLAKGKREAQKILAEIQPDVIFSKGGFVSVPVALAGAKLDIPLILHESDFSLGLANKITKRKAKVVLTTFKDTADKINNGLFVGPPLAKTEITQAEKTRIKNMYNLNSNKPICLIVGGSLGASSINKTVIEALDALLKNYQILHITGKNKSTDIKRAGYTQIEFSNMMPAIMEISDIAITRGGSNIIFELLSHNVPMLIIPLQKSSRGDQIQNANYFEKKGYALTLSEDNLNAQNLINSIKQLQTRANLMRANAKYALPKDSLDKIYNTILKYSK